MGPSTGQTANDSLELYRARVGRSSWAHLDWAVGFAQRDLKTLTPGEVLDEPRELAALLQAAGYPLRAVPTPAETHRVRQELARIFTGVARHELTPIATVSRTWAFAWDASGQRVVLGQSGPGSLTYDVVAALAMAVVAYGDKIRQCPAPGAPDSTAPCGRLFVTKRGRGRFCSGGCHNRAWSRPAREAARERAKRRAPKRSASQARKG